MMAAMAVLGLWRKSRGGQWGQLVYKQTSGWVISLIIIGFLLPNINNWSHAGGLFAGIFLAGYWDIVRKEGKIILILALSEVVVKLDNICFGCVWTN